MTRNVGGASTDIATLVAEHRALDIRVRKLDKRPYLTPEEQLEIRNLKKLKLAKKDLLASLITQQQAS